MNNITRDLSIARRRSEGELLKVVAHDHGVSVTRACQIANQAGVRTQKSSIKTDARNGDIRRRRLRGEPLEIIAHHYRLSVARVQEICHGIRLPAPLAEGPRLVDMLRGELGALTLGGIARKYPLPLRLRDPVMLRAYCILNHIAYAHETDKQRGVWSNLEGQRDAARAELVEEVALARLEALAGTAPPYKPGSLEWGSG